MTVVAKDRQLGTSTRSALFCGWCTRRSNMLPSSIGRSVRADLSVVRARRVRDHGVAGLSRRDYSLKKGIVCIYMHIYITCILMSILMTHRSTPMCRSAPMCPSAKVPRVSRGKGLKYNTTAKEQSVFHRSPKLRCVGALPLEYFASAAFSGRGLMKSQRI